MSVKNYRCDYVGCFEKITFSKSNNGFCPLHCNSMLSKQTNQDLTSLLKIFKQFTALDIDSSSSSSSSSSSMSMSNQKGSVTYIDNENIRQQILHDDDCSLSSPHSHSQHSQPPHLHQSPHSSHSHPQSPHSSHSHPQTPQPPQPSTSKSSSSFSTLSPDETRKKLLKHKLRQKIKEKHTSSHLNQQTKTKSQTVKSTHRFVLEKDGIKLTKERIDKASSLNMENVTTFAQFNTEKELETYVEHSTTLYSSAMNEYARNKDLVFSCLSKWFEDLSMEKIKNNVNCELSIDHLFTLPESELPQENKELIIYWKLWHALWREDGDGDGDGDKCNDIPVLQKINYYTIDTLPDGPRKMFYCQFAKSKMDMQHIVNLPVPEILLRAIVPYRSTIEAFMISKFIPFKTLYMKNQRQLELMSNSMDETTVQEAMDIVMEQEENNFTHSQFPEINPRTCYYVSQ